MKKFEESDIKLIFEEAKYDWKLRDRRYGERMTVDRHELPRNIINHPIVPGIGKKSYLEIGNRGKTNLTKKELLQLHDKICSEAKNIMVVKNNDYASGDDPFANFRMSKMLRVEPEIALMVRVLDKLKRIETFVNDGKLLVKNESVDDAIQDTINYMILLAGLIQERKGELTIGE